MLDYLFDNLVFDNIGVQCTTMVFFIDFQKEGCCELVFGLMGNPKASK